MVIFIIIVAVALLIYLVIRYKILGAIFEVLGEILEAVAESFND